VAGIFLIFALGATPQPRDSFARTPFHLALQYGHLPLINHILASFPPGSPDSQPVLSPPPKASLLRLAIESNSLDIVKTVMSRFKFRRVMLLRSGRGSRTRLLQTASQFHDRTAEEEEEQKYRTHWNGRRSSIYCEEYVPPSFVPSDVPRRPLSPSEPCYGHTQGASCPLAPSSQNAGDISSERTSKPTGSPAIPKRDKARRKRGTTHQRK
jgi:ankyrin repeat protein